MDGLAALGQVALDALAVSATMLRRIKFEGSLSCVRTDSDYNGAAAKGRLTKWPPIARRYPRGCYVAHQL